MSTLDIKNTLFTIGHSTHPAAEFITLLAMHRVQRLVDIRTVPRSRHNPQFNQERLKASLEEKEISYHYIKELGGLRKPTKDSPNGGWRNSGFRGYADYMQTSTFAQALEGLGALAAKERVAIMCAEAMPWRCHRSLVADALSMRGIDVRHILPEGRASPHRLTAFAQVEGDRITYPPPQLSLL